MQKELNKDYYLWKRFKEGDDESYYQLYDQYADVLYRFGKHFSRDTDFIKDCIHDLFLDLYKYRNKLSMTDSIQFYLMRSFRRKIYKGKLKIAPLNDQDVISNNDIHVLAYEDTIIATEIEIENNRTLVKAMRNLSDRQREGLSLKFEHNMTYPEIAEIQNISIESARTSIYRALKLLRESIQDDRSSIYLLFVFTRNHLLNP